MSATSGVLHDSGVFDSIDKSLAALGAAIQSVRGISVPAREAELGRLLPQHVRGLVAAQRSLTAQLRRMRGVVDRGTTVVLGEGRAKQVDVLIADWDRGLELAVSTKTLALGVEDQGEIKKNLPNRWEEFDGDLKNLRGRFPLAVIGAALVVPEAAVASGAIRDVVDMMEKLTAPGRPWVNAYDSNAIIVVRQWTGGQNADVQVLADDEMSGFCPDELRPSHFFNTLIERVLERAPVTEHSRVRERRL